MGQKKGWRAPRARPVLFQVFDHVIHDDRIEAAVKTVLTQGLRTADIYEEGTRKVGTIEMGDAVVKALG